MTPGKCMAIVQYGWAGADARGEERMEKMTEVADDAEKEVGTRSQRAHAMCFPL